MNCKRCNTETDTDWKIHCLDCYKEIKAEERKASLKTNDRYTKRKLF